MLGYLQPGSRGDKGRGGGDVEGVAAVAAGADGVDQRPVHFNSQGELPHDAGHAGEFPGGLTLQPQCGEEGTKLGWGSLPLHDLPHHRRCVGHVEGTPGHYFVDCFTDIQGCCSKKVIKAKGRSLLYQVDLADSPRPMNYCNYHNRISVEPIDQPVRSYQRLPNIPAFELCQNTTGFREIGQTGHCLIYGFRDRVGVCF